jgi:glycosyltransferase involved in cell wall biosynthesis
MRVLFYIQSLVTGGAQRVVATLSNYWVQQGWDVTIVTLTNQGSDFFRLEPRVRRVSLGVDEGGDGILPRIAANYRRIRRLRRVLRAERPQVAVAMMDTANIILALAGMRMDQIVLVGSERTHPPFSEIPSHWHVIRNVGYRYLHAVVAQTRTSAAWLKTSTQARDVRVIPNPIELPLDRHPPIVVADRVGETDRILLAAGRLVPEKNFATLIGAFSKTASDVSDWKLIILGDGPERRALTEQIVSANLTKRVLLVGEVGNIGDWYAAADLYALSSSFEGFPNTLLEALSYGLPAISFDCDSGPRDLIRNGVDGLLVPVGDVEAFASSLRRLMLDDRLRCEFSARAIEARARFSVPTVAAEWESLFQELIATVCAST